MSKEEYLQKILKELSAAMAAHKAGVFHPNEKIEDDVAIYVRNYIDENYKFCRTDFKKCQSCKGTWDILIFL